MREAFPSIRHVAESSEGGSGVVSVDNSKKKLPKQTLVSIQMAKDELAFEHGELSPDHPLEVYLNNLSLRLPKRDGVRPHIHLLPGWKEANGMCLADGTIYISAGLVEDAETEEALLGVIAHEQVHAYREHATKTKSKIKSVSDVVARFGAMRAQEYDADLRAVLVDLENAGINPLGFKAYLEKLHERDSWGGYTHGSSLDRALNIGTAAHLLDLKSLGSTISQIPETVIAEIKKLPYGSTFSAIGIRPQSAGEGSPESIAKHRQLRQTALTELPDRLIPLAIKKVYDYTKRYIGTKARDPEDKEVLRVLVRKMDAMIDAQEGDDLDKQMMKLASLELYSGLPIVEGNSALLKGRRELFSSVVRSKEDVCKFYSIVPRLLSLGFSNFQKSSGTLAEEVFSYAFEKGFFGDFNNSEADVDSLVATARTWVETLNGSALKDHEEPISILNGVKQAAISHARGSELLQKIRTAFIKESEPYILSEEKAPEKQTEEKIVLSPELLKCAKEIGESLSGANDLEHFQRGITLSAQNIIEATQNETPGVIAMVIKEVFLAIYDIQGEQLKKAAEGTTREVDKIDDRIKIYNSSYAVMKLFEEVIASHPELKQVSQKERMIAVTSAKSEVGYVHHMKNVSILLEGLDHLKPEYRNSKITSAQEEDATYIESEMRSFAKKYSTEKMVGGLVSDHESILLYHRYMIERIPLPNHLILGSRGSMGEIFEYGDERKKVFISLLVDFLNQGDFGDALEKLDALENSGIHGYDILAQRPELCGVLVLKILDALDGGAVDVLPLQSLLKASAWIANPFLRNGFQSAVLQKRWQGLLFEQKMELLFPAEGASQVQSTTFRENFLEQEVQTKEQYQEVKKRFEESIDELVYEGKAEAGIAVFTDLDLRFRDTNKILAALLRIDLGNPKAPENDRQLKLFFYDMFRLTSVNVDDEEDEEEASGKSILQSAIRRTESAVRSVFSCDAYAKQIVLRRLLVGSGGVLQSPERRRRLFEILFDFWIKGDSSEEDVTGVLKNIADVLVTTDQIELLYFALQSTLVDKIAQPPGPKEVVPYDDIYEIEIDMERLGIDISSEKEKAKFFKGTLWKTVPKDAHNKPEKFSEEYRIFSERLLYETLDKRGLMHSTDSTRLSPLGFVKEVASKTGALGVRFLQLMPQFVQIPEERAQEFSTVYDRMKGQSKLAAISLLEREWPELWDNVERIEDRIGGGSIVTVYVMRMKNGERKTIKVRNPNIEFHLNETYRFASTTLDKLAEQNGGSYSAARLSLDDIHEWISHDINFVGFLEQDKKFRDRYEGFVPDGHDYQITVPQSEAPSNAFFSVESYAPGTNLTRWEDLVQQGHDVKQIVSVVVKSYVDQIQNGQALSDVHRGNIAVTEDKKIVIYDRNFFLALGEGEQKLISALLYPLGSPQEKMEQLFDYLSSKQEITGDRANAVKLKIENIITHTEQQEWNKVQGSIVEIKNLGVKIPLTLTLLLKNFGELQLMGKKAGFKDLGEAFFYSP